MYPENTTQVPAGETDYLAQAAAHLDAVAERNQRYGPSTEVQIRVARGYALLGAIQRGVLPQEMARELLDTFAGGLR